MKKKIIIVLSALLIGGLGAYYLFHKVTIKTPQDNITTIKAFQIGAFTSYENASRLAERNNGIVVIDGDIYRVYVAILKNDLSIAKMKNYYDSIGLHYYIREINVTSSFISEIHLREQLIERSSPDTYNTINLEILNKYKELL